MLLPCLLALLKLSLLRLTDFGDDDDEGGRRGGGDNSCHLLRLRVLSMWLGDGYVLSLMEGQRR